MQRRSVSRIPSPDILPGLCYAMVRKYKAVIVRNLPVRKPVAFCDGVTRNSGMRKAILDVFGLRPEKLILPEKTPYPLPWGGGWRRKAAPSFGLPFGGSVGPVEGSV